MKIAATLKGYVHNFSAARWRISQNSSNLIGLDQHLTQITELWHTKQEICRGRAPPLFCSHLSILVPAVNDCNLLKFIDMTRRINSMRLRTNFEIAILAASLPAMAQTVVQSIQRNSAQTNSAMLLPGDPNLDPNWDWTINNLNGHTMYYSLNGAAPVRLDHIQLPFFSAGDQLNLPGTTKDMYKEDGWVLAYRDFGTATDAPPLPFFILYNKYRGLLRFMFFNAPADSHTTYKAEVKFRNGASLISETSPDQYSSALFSFSADPAKSFINTYDGSVSQFQLSPMNAFKGWATFDIVASGYDPNLAALKSDPALTVSITPIDESKVTLVGAGTMSLNQVMEAYKPAGVGSTSDLQRAFNAINTGYSDYQSASKALTEITKFSKDPQNQDKEGWMGIAVAIAATIASDGALAPYAIGLAGAINAFIGGANKGTTQPIPLNFAGKFQFTLSGNIEAQNAISWSGNYYLNSGPQMADGYRPVQNISWGVVNIDKPPTVVMDTLVDDMWTLNAGDDWEHIGTYYFYTLHTGATSPTVHVNPDCGMQLESEQIIVDFGTSRPPIATAKNESPVSSAHLFPSPNSDLPETTTYDGTRANSPNITYVFKFKINNNNIINSDKEMLFTKSYKPVITPGSFEQIGGPYR